MDSLTDIDSGTPAEALPAAAQRLANLAVRVGLLPIVVAEVPGDTSPVALLRDKLDREVAVLYPLGFGVTGPSLLIGDDEVGGEAEVARWLNGYGWGAEGDRSN